MGLSEHATSYEAIKLGTPNEKDTNTSQGSAGAEKDNKPSTSVGAKTTTTTFNTNITPLDNSLSGQDAANNVGSASWLKLYGLDKLLQNDVEDWTNNQKDTNRNLSSVLDEDRVNGIDQNQTLALSRLADALNSKDFSFWKGGAVNASGTGTNTEGNLQTIQKSQIQTPEQRAQTLAENLSQEKSSKTLNRQDILKQFPYINMQKIKSLESQYGADTSNLMLSTFATAYNLLTDEKRMYWSDKEKLRYSKDIANAIIETDDEQLRGLLMLAEGQDNGLYSNVQYELNNRYNQVMQRMQELEDINTKEGGLTAEEAEEYKQLLKTKDRIQNRITEHELSNVINTLRTYKTYAGSVLPSIK